MTRKQIRNPTTPKTARPTATARPTPIASDERLAEIVHGFGGQRVLVVGDSILDRYLWGETERTSPEAPVPVVRLERRSANLGGAANVVANLAALGARPELIGVVGADESAADFRELLRGIGVAESGLVTDRARPTTEKTRVVSMGQQLLRLDREQSGPFGEEIRRRLASRVAAALKRARLVVLSDYDKGVLGGGLCEETIRQARAAGIPVVVDPKGVDYTRYRQATVIKPNLKEAAAAAGVRIAGPEDLEEAGRRLRMLTRTEAIVISRGALGVSVFGRRGAPAHVPAMARSVYDVNGAGDSLIATLALALACGAGYIEAAQLGNLAGSIAVGKFGAATVEPLELLQGLSHVGGNRKLRTLEQLRGELRALRAAGRRIVFTNGCFDLLHPGQLQFLEQARRLGDALIVALNSDASVRAVKGPPRPVLREQERAAVLGALDCVDYLTVFDEPTPEALLEALAPDVLVKGGGAAGEIVGREIVERQGGRVVSLAMPRALSTGDYLERIAKGG